MKKLGLFLLSYKRPEFIDEAIASILKQDYADFELIISENSPDMTIADKVKPYLTDTRVQLRKRQPSMPMIDHFNQIYSEAKAYEYVMLFHDDDALLPQALAKMVKALDDRPHTTAASCNAFFIKNTTPTHDLFNVNLKQDTEVKNQAELINRYIFKKMGHTAFPSYIYRTKCIETIRLDPLQGGIYSDVSLLVKLIKNGPFIWLAEPLIRYRLHSNNVSSRVYLKQISSLSAFFIKTCPELFLNVSFYFSKQLIKKIYFVLIGRV